MRSPNPDQERGAITYKECLRFLVMILAGSVEALQSFPKLTGFKVDLSKPKELFPGAN